jgi:V/A-type H+-transporting ATPase subunit D
MAVLNIAPTKSNLLAMKRLLAFAEEGYDLLEQKRQILVAELMRRLERARAIEDQVIAQLGAARVALRAAMLDHGAESVDCAAMGVVLGHDVEVKSKSVVGLRLPEVRASVVPAGVQFGFAGSSANIDTTMERFVATVEPAAELAAVGTAILRLARELRKTQRRCNALSKIFMPAYRETIAFISEALEERERESLVILRMIRDRLAGAGVAG